MKYKFSIFRIYSVGILFERVRYYPNRDVSYRQLLKNVNVDNLQKMMDHPSYSY